MQDVIGQLEVRDEAAQPRLRFCRRPPDEVLALLKGAGWRWRRDLAAWEGPRGALPPVGISWARVEPSPVEPAGPADGLAVGEYAALVLATLRSARRVARMAEG